MSSLAGLGVPNIPGRDLFGTDFRNRLVYFHKIALPRLWGLRDGQWKFLGQIQSEEESELYNLVDDPLESKNLAQQYPARVVNYRRLAATWFYRANVDFMNQLAGFAQGNDVRPDSLKDFHQPGPKAIAFGVKNADGQFRARATIRPQDRVTVWVRWVEYGVKKKVRFKWLSPDGRVADVYDMELEPDWTTTRVTYGGRRPLVAGKWHLDVWDGETKLIGGSFEVVR